VYKGEYGEDQHAVAVKSVSRAKLNKKLLENLETEIANVKCFLFIQTLSHRVEESKKLKEVFTSLVLPIYLNAKPVLQVRAEFINTKLLIPNCSQIGKVDMSNAYIRQIYELSCLMSFINNNYNIRTQGQIDIIWTTT
jgi:hypothetical protein